MKGDLSARFAAQWLEGLDLMDAVALRESELVEREAALLRSLLGVSDSLHRLLAATVDVPEPTAEQARALLGSVRLIAQQTTQALAQVGLTPIECLGQTFDPEHHEAVGVTGGEGTGRAVIVEVVAPGFLWNGQLLRRPQVVVQRVGEGGQE